MPAVGIVMLAVWGEAVILLSEGSVDDSTNNESGPEIGVRPFATPRKWPLRAKIGLSPKRY